jgi:nucleotide-binding universal stress UspA family protein
MIKRILVPMDFSSCSLNALRYAVELTKNLKSAKLIIMHAFVSPLDYRETGITSISKHSDVEDIEDVEKKFDNLKSSIPELSVVDYTTLTKQALLADALIGLILTANIDLVVMGTNGVRGIDELIKGSNMYFVIKEVKILILVIPKNESFKRPSHIALASDFKEVSIDTLKTINELCILFRSTLSIVHIVVGKENKHQQVEEAKKFERYFKNVIHHYHYIENDDVEDGLTKYITQHNVDMLTIIPRIHPLYDMVFGSGESKKLIFHAKKPLLTLPELL